MFCSKCGKENSKESAFCCGCGADLKNGSVQQTTRHILDKQSFLAVSDEYKAKKKGLARINITMIVCAVLAFIAVMIGYIMWETILLTVGLILMIAVVVVFTPWVAIKSSRAEKLGDELYSQYIKSNQ